MTKLPVQQTDSEGSRDDQNPSPDRREAYARVKALAALSPGAFSRHFERNSTDQLRRDLRAIIAMQAPADHIGDANQLVPAVGGEDLELEVADLIEFMNAKGAPTHEDGASLSLLGRVEALPSTAVGGGQPVAWDFEVMVPVGEWTRDLSRFDPLKRTTLNVRNVRPLYAHPTPVREPEGWRAALIDLERIMDQRAERELKADPFNSGFIALRHARDVVREILAQPTPPSLGEAEQVKND